MNIFYGKLWCEEIMEIDAREVERGLIALDEEVSYKAFIGSPSAHMSSATVPNDLDGLKQLIAEKEKDLELAARIGQSLLSKNRILQLNHDELEQLFTVTQDELTQLRHELAMNKELLRVCLLETSDDDFDHETDSQSQRFSLKQIQCLQHRIRDLEDENHRLRLEAKELCSESADFATKDTEVIHECVRELAEAKAQLKGLTDGIQKKSEENARLQEEVSALLNDMSELRSRLQKSSSENDQLQDNVTSYTETQEHLAAEVIHLQEKCDHLRSVAQELEDELREVRRNGSYVQSWAESSAFSADTLASELNISLQHSYNYVGLSDDEDAYYRNVMDIAGLVNADKSRVKATYPHRHSGAALCSTTSSPRSRGISPGKRAGYQNCDDGMDNALLGSYFGSESWTRTSTDASSVTLDEGIEDRSSQALSSASSLDNRHCATPDSALSLGSGNESSRSSRTGHARHDFSEKLVLVKPYEGSGILTEWRQLGHAGFDSCLGSRPGIVTKGQHAVPGQVGVQAVVERRYKNPAESNNSPVLTRDRFANAPTFPSAKFPPNPNSVFSVGALKTNLHLTPQPVFPRPAVDSGPGVDLTILCSSGVDLKRTSSEEVIRIDSPPSVATSRSRRSSGSLSSASRSPSPPHSSSSLVPTHFASVISPNYLGKMIYRSPLLSLNPQQHLGQKAAALNVKRMSDSLLNESKK